MIERMHIVQMGKLNRTDFHLEQKNVICGVNESGKSTLVEALKIAYFGYPSKKAQGFKYGASKLQFSWRAQDGSSYLVERELDAGKQRSRIVGKNEGGEGIAEMIPLPIRRELFELLFCVDENRLHLFRKEEWSLTSTVLLDSVSGGVINNLEEIREELQEEKKRLYSTRANSKSALHLRMEELKMVEEQLRQQGLREQNHRRMEADCLEAEEHLSVLTTESTHLRKRLMHLKQTLSDYHRSIRYRKLRDSLLVSDEEEVMKMLTGARKFLETTRTLVQAVERVEEERASLPCSACERGVSRQEGEMMTEAESCRISTLELAQAKKHLPKLRKDYLAYLEEESEKRRFAEERTRLEDALSRLPNVHPLARLDEAEGISRLYQTRHMKAVETVLLILSAVLVIAGLYWKANIWSLIAIFVSVLTILFFVLRSVSKRGLKRAFERAMRSEEASKVIGVVDALYFERARTAAAYEKRLQILREMDLVPKGDPYGEYGGFDEYWKSCEKSHDAWIEEQRLVEKREQLDIELDKLIQAKKKLNAESYSLLQNVIRLTGQEWNETEKVFDEELAVKLGYAISVLDNDLQTLHRMRDLEREGKVDFEAAEGDDYSPAVIDRLEQRLDSCSEEILECKSAIAEHRAFLANASYDPSLEGKKRYLEREIENLRMDAKRLGLFEYMLEDAVRSYRESHQPLFARKISEYLSIVIGEEVTILVDTSKGFSYELIRGGEAISHLDAMSTGFVQQLAFCSRLALMDVVDPHRSLPIILDDALAFWDETRRKNAFRLLSRLERVIYYATCSVQRLPQDWNIINML